MSWIDYIKKEDLPEDYQIMVEAIGLEDTIKLAHNLFGIPVYLQKPDKLFRPAKVKYILDKYSQSCPASPFNHRRMAIETGMSVREIYTILENERKKKLKT